MERNRATSDDGRGTISGTESGSIGYPCAMEEVVEEVDNENASGSFTALLSMCI